MDLSEAAAGIVAAGAPGAVALRRTGSGTEIDAAGDASAESRFRIGSVTKTYTAALCLLAEIPLDEPVDALIPDLPEACRRPTLRQLLMHRSGLFDHVWDGERGTELLFDFSSRPDPRRDATTALHGSWADGAIVADARELAAFYTALLDGTLLPPGSRRELLRAKPADERRVAGLGIFGTALAPDATAWGHGGGLPGYLSRVFASDDGERVVVVLANGQSPHVHDALERAADELFRTPP